MESIDFLSVFFAGVLVSFTPCVYPVLPIVSSVVTGVNLQGSVWRSFWLSVVYVFGLALTYAFLAFLAVMMGKVFGTFQQTPFALLMIAGILFLFSLMMFDVVSFPSITMKNIKNSYQGLWTVFMMGLVSGLMVAPCTAPVLGSVLLYVAGRENVLYGCLLLFVFAYGVGFSLILVGTFSGLLMHLPKPGYWMVWIKKGIGFLLLLFSFFYMIQFIQKLIER